MVRVIRGETGTESTVMRIEEALAMAEELSLDLVEVGPNQNPPVCRLLDYGRFRYMQSKKEKEARKASRTASQQREVRMSPVISENDIQSKIRVVKGLLEEGAKVRVAVTFRGRQQSHPEIAMRVLRKVAEGVKDQAKLERAPTMEGRALSIMLAPDKTQQQQQQTKKQEQPAAASVDGAGTDGAIENA
jgi:translation initiation factor IF-3